MQGKAAVFQAPESDFLITEYEVPKPEPNSVVIDVSMATICGSDLHRYHGRGAPTPKGAIIGHESVGRIASLGAGVTTDYTGKKVQVGDRVTYCYFSYCGRCYYCLNKQATACLNRFALSGGLSSEQPPHFNGSFAEYIYLRPGMAFFKVPDDLPDEVLAPVNCALSSVYHGISKIGGVPYGGYVLVQGAGGLGTYAAAIAKHMGAEKVIVEDKVRSRLETIRKFGADETVEVQGTDSAERIKTVKELTGGRGADLAIEVSGAPGLIDEGFRMLRRRGRYLEIGCVSSESQATIDFSTVVLNELKVLGNLNYEAWVIPQVLKFLQSTMDVFPFREMVTHRFSLEQASEAIKVADQRTGLRVALVP